MQTISVTKRFQGYRIYRVIYQCTLASSLFHVIIMDVRPNLEGNRTCLDTFDRFMNLFLRVRMRVLQRAVICDLLVRMDCRLMSRNVDQSQV
jgi:hypothetical protein